MFNWFKRKPKTPLIIPDEVYLLAIPKGTTIDVGAKLEVLQPATWVGRGKHLKPIIKTNPKLAFTKATDKEVRLWWENTERIGRDTFLFFPDCDLVLESPLEDII
jgi:hypothetical protein